jgi:hypothetical protein
MAAYSAFVVLRDYIARNPQLETTAAIDIIRLSNTDDAGLDYVGGAIIHQLIEIDISGRDRRTALRLVACELVKAAMPWWLRLVPYGREMVRSALDQDQVQCLREAGLFDPVPNPEVIAWWDEIAAIMRGTVDNERMLRAREAERQSLEYERIRLLSLGIGLEPEWVSLEDNTLGYDIRSYDLQDERVVSRLIEVKSTTSDSIFISRNEWLNASSAEKNYCFHVWKFPERSVVEYPVASMKPNIPVDQGAGAWQEVRITLEAWLSPWPS